MASTKEVHQGLHSSNRDSLTFTYESSMALVNVSESGDSLGGTAVDVYGFTFKNNSGLCCSFFHWTMIQGFLVPATFLSAEHLVCRSPRMLELGILENALASASYREQ